MGVLNPRETTADVPVQESINLSMYTNHNKVHKAQLWKDESERWPRVGSKMSLASQLAKQLEVLPADVWMWFWLCGSPQEAIYK